MEFRTMADASDAVKYFTRAGRNLTQQGLIRAQSPALYESLKEQGAEIDRKLDARVIEIDRLIAQLQDERQQISGQRSPQSKTTIRRW